METLKKINEKRKILKEYSQTAKKLQEKECEGMTINEILINNFYKSDEHSEFNTLFEWNKKGYRIKKGEKAFLVWGKPKKNKEEGEQEKDKKNDFEENDFYPICFLFSNAQVIQKDA